MAIPCATTTDLRKFGFLMAFVLILIFGLTQSTIAWTTGAAFLIFALLFPRALNLVYIPWMKLGHVLGWINTRILLSICFFLLITPIGLIKRLGHTDPMNKKYDPNTKTYRKVTPTQPITHMEKPF